MLEVNAKNSSGRKSNSPKSPSNASRAQAALSASVKNADSRSARSSNQRTSAKGDKWGGVSSQRVLKSEATIAFDKLLVAQLEMSPLFRALSKHCDASTDVLKLVRQKILDHEVQWLGVMQRLTANTSQPYLEILPFLKTVATGANENVHRALILSKLSTLLVLPQMPKEEVVGIILACLSNPDNITMFLQRQEGLSNLGLAISAQSNSVNDIFSVVMLIANILGRLPTSVHDLISAKLDLVVASVGVSNVARIQQEEGKHVMKAVLYCLRFFVREKADNTHFIETCLSLSAHSIAVLNDEATDLCGDMCAVVRDFRFAKTNQNIFLNLIAIVPKVNPSRTSHIIRFLGNYIQSTAKEVREKFTVYAVACAMLLTKKQHPSTVPEAVILLELLSTAVDFVGVDAIEKHIDYNVMGKVRDILLQPGEGINTPGKVRFIRLLYLFCASGHPAMGVSRMLVSFNDAVGTHISDETFMQIVKERPTKYSNSLKGFDKKIKTFLESWRSEYEKLEESEEKIRGSEIAIAEEELREKILADEKFNRQEIASTDKEALFQVFDRTAILFHKREVSELKSAAADWIKMSAEDIQNAKDKYSKDSVDLMAKLNADLETKLKSSSFSEREKSEIKTRFKIKADDQKRKMRIQRESVLNDKKWREKQGTLFFSSLANCAEKEVTVLNRSELYQVEFCEEIERGCGFTGISSTVPDTFMSISTEEAIAWRGIERLATKVFAPQQHFMMQCKERLLQREHQEERHRLFIEASAGHTFIEVTFLESIELLATTKDSKYARLLFNASNSAFMSSITVPYDISTSSIPFASNSTTSLQRYGGGYGATLQVPGEGGAGLRRVPSRRRSLSLFGSEAQNLDVCQEQEEAIRAGIEQEGREKLAVIVDTALCISAEGKGRAVFDSIVNGHYERALQALEAIQRIGIQESRMNYYLLLAFQNDEAEDRLMIENAYQSASEFYSEIDLGCDVDLVDVLVQMLNEPVQHGEGSLELGSTSMLMGSLFSFSVGGANILSANHSLTSKGEADDGDSKKQ